MHVQENEAPIFEQLQAQSAISSMTISKMKSWITQRCTKYIKDLELIYGPPRPFDYSLVSALLMNYVSVDSLWI